MDNSIKKLQNLKISTPDRYVITQDKIQSLLSDKNEGSLYVMVGFTKGTTFQDEMILIFLKKETLLSGMNTSVGTLIILIAHQKNMKRNIKSHGVENFKLYDKANGNQESYQKHSKIQNPSLSLPKRDGYL